MTRAETIMMLKLMRAAYPNFYSKFSKDELNNTVDLWSEMFADEHFDIVKYALKELITTHSGFPPDIAALKAKIRELMATATDEPTDEELWQMLKKAVSNGTYGAKKEFDKLPLVLQRYCGSPYTLTELAQVDSDTFNTVNHGQFLKQIKVIKAREEYSQRLPENVRMLASAFAKPMLSGDRPLSLPEVNDRRNEILDKLEGY